MAIEGIGSNFLDNDILYPQSKIPEQQKDDIRERHILDLDIFAPKLNNKIDLETDKEMGKFMINMFKPTNLYFVLMNTVNITPTDSFNDFCKLILKLCREMRTTEDYLNYIGKLKDKNTNDVMYKQLIDMLKYEGLDKTITLPALLVSMYKSNVLTEISFNLLLHICDAEVFELLPIWLEYQLKLDESMDLLAAVILKSMFENNMIVVPYFYNDIMQDGLWFRDIVEMNRDFADYIVECGYVINNVREGKTDFETVDLSDISDWFKIVLKYPEEHGEIINTIMNEFMSYVDDPEFEIDEGDFRTCDLYELTDILINENRWISSDKLMTLFYLEQLRKVLEFKQY